MARSKPFIDVGVPTAATNMQSMPGGVRANVWTLCALLPAQRPAMSRSCCHMRASGRPRRLLPASLWTFPVQPTYAACSSQSTDTAAREHARCVTTEAWNASHDAMLRTSGRAPVRARASRSGVGSPTARRAAAWRLSAPPANCIDVRSSARAQPLTWYKNVGGVEMPARERPGPGTSQARRRARKAARASTWARVARTWTAMLAMSANAASTQGSSSHAAGRVSHARSCQPGSATEAGCRPRASASHTVKHANQARATAGPVRLRHAAVCDAARNPSTCCERGGPRRVGSQPTGSAPSSSSLSGRSAPRNARCGDLPSPPVGASDTRSARDPKARSDEAMQE